jgi:hypothetical protein
MNAKLTNPTSITGAPFPILVIVLKKWLPVIEVLANVNVNTEKFHNPWMRTTPK